MLQLTPKVSAENVISSRGFQIGFSSALADPMGIEQFRFMKEVN